MGKNFNKTYKHRPGHYSIILFFSILFCILIFNCDSPTGPVGSAVITYTVSGGFAGGIHTKLVIDEYGQASLETETPVLKQTLSAKEYRSILMLFKGFSLLKDSYNGGCMDIPVYTIEYRGNNYTKVVIADGCALSDSADPGIVKLRQITNRLSCLADQIYKNKTQVIGLSAEFKIKKSI